MKYKTHRSVVAVLLAVTLLIGVACQSGVGQQATSIPTVTLMETRATPTPTAVKVLATPAPATSAVVPTPTAEVTTATSTVMPTATAEVTPTVACPFGRVNDPYPGRCKRYVDTNNNGLCDLSEPGFGDMP